MGTLTAMLVSLLIFIAFWIVGGILYYLQLRRLARERQGETICHFARSLDYRRLDTNAIRAVYERLQSHFGSWLPIRASDELEGTFQLDPEEVEDLVTEIANHCGRSLEGWERNPYYGKLTTVSDLIEFLCAQPKAQTLRGP